MSLEQNIVNSFKVVEQTYENLDKLMKFCDAKAGANGFEVTTDKFLRYKSDRESSGWFVKYFIKCYQFKKDLKLRNKFRNGPIFAFEVDFEDKVVIHIGKYVFSEIKNLRGTISPANYKIFDHPLYDNDYGFEHSQIERIAEEEYIISRPLNGIQENYWGLEKVVFKTVNLVKVSVENVEETIFGTFIKLADISN